MHEFKQLREYSTLFVSIGQLVNAWVISVTSINLLSNDEIFIVFVATVSNKRIFVPLEY